ncbi:hypothetical protein MAC_07525 [Metarhizium acridum CQMa 102]|uniref:Deoxyribonuclease NucA/NucB domain-containing protein n=1 Tax=Metarhizium acridum (strain CQMa 102) TaxID=655827 RepID=E9ECC7_METAQ|nr:uncharacterized protein MAC_07525 [Metarhizium acridum CQMa 102]EFY86447.1 hypothetical protein MAC_07525 [Metarhizium acridum CQMa 102]
MHVSFAAVVILLVGSAAAKGVVYDCEKTPQICLNTCWAIKCQKNSETLHGGGQTKDNAKKYGDDNRKKWGYDKDPCKKKGWAWKGGNSPDEYPYASSKEGGQSDFAKKVALRCVPGKEQQRQGRKVRGIATSKNGEQWNTKWDKISKLPEDWCGPKPKCQNDGHQFVSGGPNGPWTLAANPKVVRDIGSYSEDGDSSWVSSRDIPDDVELPEDFDGDDGGVEARDVDEEDNLEIEDDE